MDDLEAQRVLRLSDTIVGALAEADDLGLADVALRLDQARIAIEPGSVLAKSIATKH